MITRATLSTIEQGLPKYRSMLAGNPAFFPNSFESIATITTTGGEASVTLTSIPSTYKHLQIRARLRSDGGGTGGGDVFRFNNFNETTSYHSLTGDGTTVSASGTASSTNMQVFSEVRSGSGLPNTYGVTLCDILDYTSSSMKTVRIFTGFENNGSGTVGIYSSLFQATDPVTSIRIYSGLGSFSANCSIALYGIKG